MVTFNLHHGQSRIAATFKGRPVGMRHRDLTPKKALMFALGNDDVGFVRVHLQADENGDVEVSDPKEMEHLAILGWPVHTPDGELIWRESDRQDDPLAVALPDGAVHLTPYRHIMHPVSFNGELHCWCEEVFSNG